MGWSFTKGATKESIVAVILRPWEFTVTPEDAKYYNKLKSGDRSESIVLKHKLSGNTLWYIRQTTVTRADGEVEVTKWIGVSMLESDRGYGWGHKDMDESMGVYASGCPVAWFKEVPCPDSDYARDWRMAMKGTPVDRCGVCKKLKPGPNVSLFENPGELCSGHDGQLIVTAAWGDWHAEVPEGWVGVVAVEGGRENGADESKRHYHLVPKGEYNAGSFVVDPAIHPVWNTTQNRATKQVALV